MNTQQCGGGFGPRPHRSTVALIYVRHLVAKREMGPWGVVIRNLGGNQAAGMIGAEEERFV